MAVEEGALVVREVSASSPAARSGLEAGDRILAIDSTVFDRAEIGVALLEKLLGGEPAELRVLRDGREHVVRFTPEEKPLEELEGLDTYYDVIDAPDGARLRTIITRPAGTHGPLPAIFFVQWVSCDSVELVGEGAYLDVFRAIAQRSGMAMLRMERTANGDSRGPLCHELDYDTELAHYRYALGRFAASEHVDPRRIVVLGNSLGSTMVPLVALGHRVAGAVVTSGGALPYYERMLIFDRQSLERSDFDPRDVHGEMTLRARFHVKYLLEEMTPEEIATEDPELGAVWSRIVGSGEGVHYGRPYRYHHQAARKNFLAAWMQVEAPILVIFNSFDQFESAHGAELIVESVDRVRPGTATYVELPQLGHSFNVYPSAVDAYRWENGGPAPELAVHHILRWLGELGLTSSDP